MTEMECNIRETLKSRNVTLVFHYIVHICGISNTGVGNSGVDLFGTCHT
jgi:hypothetical protein